MNNTRTLLQGAQCFCAPGYYGDGLDCREPPTYTPKQLLNEGIDGQSEPVHDLEMVSLGNNRIALVYRNSARLNRGYLMLGSVDGVQVTSMILPISLSFLIAMYSRVEVDCEF